MKPWTSLIIVSGLIGMNSVVGQQNVTDRDYSRISLTVIYIDDPNPDPNYNGSISQSVRSYMEQTVLVGPKYNDHTISTRFVGIDIDNFTSENRTMIGNSKESGQILDFINHSDISRKIVSKWFDRKPDGTLSMDLIGQRGLYNANDNDYITAAATQRQFAGLKDQGEKLLKFSYLLFVNFSDIKYTEGKTAGSGAYSGFGRAYLYKLEWNDSISANFYENLWISEGDNESVKSTKKQKFDSAVFPVVHVRNVNASAIQSTISVSGNQTSDADKRKALFTNLYNNLMFELDSRVPEFQVRQNLISSHPIGATVGTKEGLYVDQRFFVYENIQKKNKELDKRRRAVLRAKKVVDNEKITEGRTTPSTFYQVAGGKVDHFGMYIEQKNDKGISVIGSFLYGEMGGLNLTLGYNLSRSFSKTLKMKTIPTGLNFFLDLALNSETYGGIYPVAIAGYYTSEESKKYSFIRASGGFSKDIYFLKNFHIAPRIGYGIEYVSLYSKEDGNTDFPDGLTAMGDHVLAGGSVGMNLLHNFQIIAGLNYYIPIGDLWVMAGSKEPVTMQKRWSSVFHGREGLSVFAGIRILL